MNPKIDPDNLETVIFASFRDRAHYNKVEKKLHGFVMGVKGLQNTVNAVFIGSAKAKDVQMLFEEKVAFAPIPPHMIKAMTVLQTMIELKSGSDHHPSDKIPPHISRLDFDLK